MTTTPNKWITYAAVLLPAALLVAWLVVRTFLFDFHRVPSASMYPTIPEGSFIIVDKRGYGHYGLLGIEFLHRPMTATVARGDIVVHYLPTDAATLYVKRVIGLPGEEIEYSDNRLKINGKATSVTDERVEGSMRYATEVADDVRIPIAWDSARYATDYQNVVPKDHYVVFGDNRNNARDSRFIGPIAKEKIAGKVVKVISFN